jgi:hypothetical protein
MLRLAAARAEWWLAAIISLTASTPDAEALPRGKCRSLCRRVNLHNRRVGTVFVKPLRLLAPACAKSPK